ncbi:MAG TPA: hypothetical protein VMT34_08860 [Aggregatilineales bacterium]|nr:hypothetical protein [Aggregatilineales bacterium]
MIAYYLPWWNGRAAALSANAYDLAEFIVPVGRYANPPLLATFALRGVFAGLAILFGLEALQVRSFWRWLAGGLAAVLGITLLPPPDFFLSRLWDDVNYRQQFLVALGTGIILVALALVNRQKQLPRILPSAVALLVIAAAIAGEVGALDVVRSFHVEAPVGIGCVGLVLVMVVNLGLALRVRQT